MRKVLLTVALLLLCLPMVGEAQGIRYFPSQSSIQAGSGTGAARIGGVLYATAGAVATSGTSEETLLSYALPANTLDSAGRGIRITAFGYTAANGNNKEAILYLGDDVVASLAYSGLNNQAWTLTATILKVSSNLQTSIGKATYSAVAGGAITDRQMLLSAAGGVLNQADTSAINILVRARTGTAAGDLTAQGLIVEMLN